MHTLKTLISLLAATACTFVFADTLELADGSVLEGDFVGSSNGIIMFHTGESIEAFPEDEVVGILFSEGVATAEELAAESTGSGIVAPAGSRLMLRMVDTVDSKKHKAGHKFRAQLESALVVDGFTLAPRGTKVGAGASIVTSGESVFVPSGTLLETSLRTPLSIS